MKKILIFITALAMSLPALSQELVILHVNDTHSHLDPLRAGDREGMGGVIERASYVDSVRKADGKRNVFLLHAGDFSQGTSYFTKLGGDIEISLINAMKYDAVTVGNHEFDNGLDELARRLKSVKCPVVCANYDFSSSVLGKCIRPCAIVRRAGMKIGIFGMLTDVAKVVDSSIAAGISRLDNAETANEVAAYLKNRKKCDFVIVLSHLGFAGENFTDRDLVNSTRNIDLVVGGHSHTELKDAVYFPNLDGKPVPVVQDGCWGLYMGKMIVTKKK